MQNNKKTGLERFVFRKDKENMTVNYQFRPVFWARRERTNLNMIITSTYNKGKNNDKSALYYNNIILLFYSYAKVSCFKLHNALHHHKQTDRKEMINK